MCAVTLVNAVIAPPIAGAGASTQLPGVVTVSADAECAPIRRSQVAKAVCFCAAKSLLSFQRKGLTIIEKALCYDRFNRT